MLCHRSAPFGCGGAKCRLALGHRSKSTQPYLDEGCRVDILKRKKLCNLVFQELVTHVYSPTLLKSNIARNFFENEAFRVLFLRESCKFQETQVVSTVLLAVNIWEKTSTWEPSNKNMRLSNESL